MSDATATVNPPGKAEAPGKSSNPGGDLRARHAEIVAGGGIPAKRGPGRPAGSRAAVKQPAPPPVDPQAALESLRRKVGLAFRGSSMALALSTDCNVWLLAPEEEKLLGESIGDIAHDLGIADSFVFKIIFAAGVMGGVYGPKAIGYLGFAAQRRAAAEQVKKGAEAKPEQPKEKKEPDVIPETKPGLH